MEEVGAEEVSSGEEVSLEVEVWLGVEAARPVLQGLKAPAE